MEIKIQTGRINAIWGPKSENSARVPIAYCVGCNPLEALSAQLPRNGALRWRSPVVSAKFHSLEGVFFQVPLCESKSKSRFLAKNYSLQEMAFKWKSKSKLDLLMPFGGPNPKTRPECLLHIVWDAIHLKPFLRSCHGTGDFFGEVLLFFARSTP